MKASDEVRHKGINFKLKQNGNSKNLLELLAEILNDRKLKVVLNGQDSDGCYWRSFLRIHSRCFVVFGCINDIATGLSSNVKLTAEKTSLFSVTQDKHTSKQSELWIG